MQQYPIWKPILIVVVIVLSVVMIIPPEKKLKLGKDLAGGSALEYQVDVPEGMSSTQAVEQVIKVMSKRVDPAGVRNLGWRQVSGDRLEVSTALAPKTTQDLRDKWVEAQRELIEGGFTASELKRALALQGEARDTQLAALAGGDEDTLARFKAVVEAKQAVDEATKPYEAFAAQVKAFEADLQSLPSDAPERKEREADLNALVEQGITHMRNLNRAEDAYDAAFLHALDANLDAEALDEIYALSNTPKTAADGTVAKTNRELAIEKLIEKHPGRADAIRAVTEAYAAYEAERGPFDDVNDLIQMLKGSGVLEFRVCPAPGVLADEQEYREQLKEDGPNKGFNKPYKWFVIDDPIEFASDANGFAAMQADPAGYFANQRGLIGERYNDKYYLLLSNIDADALTQSDPGWKLVSARPGPDDTGLPAVHFTLNPVGGSLMRELTTANKDKPMAIVLDGRVFSAPNINSAIGANGMISGGRGGFARAELEYLVNTLSAGSLASSMTGPITIDTTGPQFGEDNLQHGLQAAVWALIIVALFMAVYYFLMGMVANFALFANMVIILAVMSLLRGTFTLPGIAGIVLTIGMAVDANVLIFERIREELEQKTDIRAAVRLGYEKAFSTILDANVTTLITCVVLYYRAGTDLRGFALTLGIGIVASMFTALFCSRVLVDLYLLFSHAKTLPMLTTTVPSIRKLLSPNVDWIGKRYGFFVFSLVLSVVGLFLLAQRGAEMFDIEFRGGSRITFELREGEMMTNGDAKERLDAVANNPEITENLRRNYKNYDPEVFLSRNATVVTAGDRQGELASSFRLEFLETDVELVSEVVRQAFEDKVERLAPIHFKDEAAEDLGSAPVYAVDSGLAAHIGADRLDELSAAGYRGGVAVIMDNISPAVTPEVVKERLTTARFKASEQTGQSAKFRDMQVIGLDAAEETGEGGELVYTRILVVTKMEPPNYLDDPGALLDPGGFAAQEWELIRNALRQNTSFGNVAKIEGTVTNERKYQAIEAMVLSLLAVVIYIWFRFGSIRYGFAAIAALVHDVSIALGLLAISHYVYDNFLGQLLGLSDFKINLATIAALLTIVGYSLNDTIVVFDRIRENRGRLAVASGEIINDSINQTISRTVITSVTTLIAVSILYWFGGDGVHGFSFALMVGVFVGTYSSIAVASPLLLITAKAALEAGPEDEDGDADSTAVTETPHTT